MSALDSNENRSHPAASPYAGVDDVFIRRLTECQNRLYAYILSLLPDPELARDVLQETNVVLWRKADQFQEGTSFPAWACKVAYFEVLGARRKLRRERLLFDEATLALVADEVEKRLRSLDDRSVALEECLQKLDQRQRQRLIDRYGPGGSLEFAAEKAGQTRGSLSVALHRIRHLLMQCIDAKIARGAAS
jgi:RNA polymerase sigma-70 factor (ECF subfamily)